MFKAVDSRGGAEVVILDNGWRERVEELRILDREDRLVCQGCRQPVRVKAGAIRTWHFAHKHLQDCRLGLESPELLAARAMLYARLQRQFGGAVTLEKQLGDVRVPRPVDCWVEAEAGPIAYWIFDSQARPEIREGLRVALGDAGARAIWLFTAGMLHGDAEEENLVHLSTTERESLQEAYVDCDLVGTCLVQGQSLCYLDPAEETMIAYRGLHLVHEPQLYRGRRVCGRLADALVNLQTGGLAHRAERDRVRGLRQELARREREERDRQERARREQAERERLARLALEREERARRLRQEREAFERELDERLERERRAQWSTAAACVAEPAGAMLAAPSGGLGVLAREGVCELCGKRTRDWSTYNGATGTCKCRRCMAQGAGGRG